MSLGIIPELELDCFPRPGEAVVAWVDGYERRLGASEFPGSKVIYVGQWEQFSHRYCGPWAQREYFCKGDIVVPGL